MVLAHGLISTFLTLPVLGQVHHFYSGYFSGDSLYGIEFNEQSSELSVIYNGTLDVSSSKWIATDVCHSWQGSEMDTLTNNRRRGKETFTLPTATLTKVTPSPIIIPLRTREALRFRKAVRVHERPECEHMR